MEELIYIIIGVIWLAATIYKASQKKKQQPLPNKAAPDAYAEKTDVSATRSLLEQLLEGQQLSVPEPEVTEMEIQYDEPMVAEAEERQYKSAFQNEYARRGFKGLEALSGEGVSSLGQITFTDIMKEADKKAGGPVKIDLRKAIIYSAILERPYT